MKLIYKFQDNIYKHRDYYFFLLDKRMTKSKFLKKLKLIKKSYMEKTFSNAYDCLVSEIYDLKKEYYKYHKLEYRSFESFLYKKYNLSISDIDEIIEAMKSNKFLKLNIKEKNSYNDYSLESFLLSEDIRPIIEKNLIL